MILKERQEIAKALNFGKYPVLTYDLDGDKGSKAVAIHKSQRYGDMRYNCELFRDSQTGDFYLMTHATMITSTVSVNDWIECAEYANAPVIDSHAEVAILIYSEAFKKAIVHIVKSGKVNPSYATATNFVRCEEVNV